MTSLTPAVMACTARLPVPAEGSRTRSPGLRLVTQAAVTVMEPTRPTDICRRMLLSCPALDVDCWRCAKKHRNAQTKGRKERGRMAITRRSFIGSAAITTLSGGSGLAQRNNVPTIRIGVLTDLSGPYRDMG